ncbi:hypothetical protein [Pseudomonas typographi]|uniref:Bbp19 family protein n=1 Tax=Pseudomonas typographi TaxID=2715964 RepID=UPI001685D1E8|nr:hypothetical protein [Pseudomonas typographi]MBD1555015.1 hypothetical protein [Pseudomonas typographi]
MYEDDEILQAREAKQRLAEQRRDDDFQWLMGDLRGRRIVWGWLCESCMFHTTFDTHGGRMSLNEGRRQIGLKLTAEIHRLCPDLYSVMVRENSKQPDEVNQ